MVFEKIVKRWLSERVIQEHSHRALQTYIEKVKQELEDVKKNNWTHRTGWVIE
jgi:hypothetical protein